MKPDDTHFRLSGFKTTKFLATNIANRYTAKMHLTTAQSNAHRALAPRLRLGTRCNRGSAATQSTQLRRQATNTTTTPATTYDTLPTQTPQHTTTAPTPKRSPQNNAAPTATASTTTANLTSGQTASSPPQSKQKPRHPARAFYIALLRILVATIGYIHRLRQRPPSYHGRSTSPATHRNHAYNTSSAAPSHRNHPLRSTPKTKTYNYDDIAHNYDALHNLRRRPYKTKEQYSPTCLNDMSQYRAYFVPGGVDPSGTCSDKSCAGEFLIQNSIVTNLVVAYLKGNFVGANGQPAEQGGTITRFEGGTHVTHGVTGDRQHFPTENYPPVPEGHELVGLFHSHPLNGINGISAGDFGAFVNSEYPVLSPDGKSVERTVKSGDEHYVIDLPCIHVLTICDREKFNDCDRFDVQRAHRNHITESLNLGPLERAPADKVTNQLYESAGIAAAQKCGMCYYKTCLTKDTFDFAGFSIPYVKFSPAKYLGGCPKKKAE